MTLAIDKLRRKARYEANKFAKQQWPDTKRIHLDQVTAWEDPQGYSVWAVERKNHTNFQYVRVENASFHAMDWSF